MRFPIPGNAKISPNSAIGREMAAAARRRQEQERAGQERLLAERKQYLAEIDAELDREAREAAEPKPALDPVEVLRQEMNARTGRLDPEKIKRYPEGWMIRQMDKVGRRAERENQAREERERNLGLPKEQARWDSDQQKIRTGLALKDEQSDERCRTDKEANRAIAEVELSELGPRPSLADYEVMTVYETGF